MRKTISILIILVPMIGLAQDPIIDTLNYGSNVDHVVNYLHYDDEDEKIISKSYFNDKGLYAITYYGYNARIQKRTLFEYDKNGLLQSIKGDRYISLKNDSIEDALFKEMGRLIKNNVDNESEEWKKYNEKYKILREYVNPEQVKWKSGYELSPGTNIIRNVAGKDSIIEYYSILSDSENYLDERILFYYNEHGKLIRKLWIDIPQENVFEFQAFKPSSLELEDSIKVLTNSFKEKTFTYYPDSIRIKYSVNGTFTGSEIRKTTNDGLVREEIVFNAKSDTLSYFVEHYNSNNLRAMRQRVKHEGYNGFGYSLDLEWGDIKRYKYDSKNRLIRIDGYDRDTHIFTQRFEIIEK